MRTLQGQRRVRALRLAGVFLVITLVTVTGNGSPGETSTPAAVLGAACSGTWSAQWHAQSAGYIKLNPGTQQTVNLQLQNTGTCTWDQATTFLGTWNPEPGQDQPSKVGGNGTNGGPNTNWANYNRIGMLQTSVAPGGIADFSFNVVGPQSPHQPGRYRLHVRPVIEGVTWMQDLGIWFEVQDAMTNSRYMNQIDPSSTYDLGCKLGTMDSYAPGTQDDFVFLDYGGAAYDFNGTNYEYGAKLPTTQAFVGICQITVAVEEFGHGFYTCARNTGPGDATSTVRVGVGTNNSGPSTAFGHGQAWANMVNSIANYWVAQQFSSQVSPAGANDLELTFSTPAAARDWINGYDSTNNYFLYDFGDSASCPESGSTSTPAQCGTTGWSQEDVYWKAFGASPSYPFPEIYNTLGAQARQWQQIELYAYLAHGSTFPIKGVLTQYEACLTRGCSGTDNKPQDGLGQLLSALNGDPRTASAANVEWLSDIAWNSDPNANP